MRETADGQEGLRKPDLEEFVGRRVADKIGGVANECDARGASEEFRVGELHLGAVGEFEIVGESEIFSFGREVGHELSHLAAEHQGAGRIAELEAVRIAPAREPFEEGSTGDVDEIAALFGFGVKVGDPLNAFPIRSGEELLFMRGACAEIEQFRNAALLFAGAGAIHIELHLEEVQRAAFADGFRCADNTERGAGCIEVQLLRGKHPFLELRDEFFLLLGGFDFGEAFEICVWEEFARQGAVVLEKKERGFFEAGFAGDGEHARPPGGAGEIFAGERELLEVIFEQKESALRVGTVGENVQEVGALGDGRFGIGELAAQIRESPVGFIQNIMVSIILRGLGSTRRTITTNRFRHLGSLLSPVKATSSLSSRHNGTR